MTRWLVTGAGGMLGSDLCSALTESTDGSFTAATRAKLDLTNPAAAAEAVAAHDIVVNAAAHTDVDGAERDPAAAMAVNGTAVAQLADACASRGAILIHVSTDYVFGGDATTPYPEDAPTAPINAYGRSKLAGERAVLRSLPNTGYVVRTAWLYGASGANFVSTMLRLATERETVQVVTDQRGQPTWTAALARQLIELGRAAATGRATPGVYHGTAAGEATWYDLARAAFTETGLDPDRVRPTTSDRFPRPAPRPSYSVLGHARWATSSVAALGPWRPMLAEAVAAGGFAPAGKL